MLATIFATSESVNAALRDQCPLDKRQDFPHCYASDLRVPQSYKKAMSSEYSKLWEELFARELCGLLDAGTFEPMYQSIESYIHVKWVFNCKVDEYGWLKKYKSRLEERGDMQKAWVGFGGFVCTSRVAVSSVRLLAALAREQSFICATLISSRL